MTKYLDNRAFSSPPANDKTRANHEITFGKEGENDNE